MNSKIMLSSKHLIDIFLSTESLTDNLQLPFPEKNKLVQMKVDSRFKPFLKIKILLLVVFHRYRIYLN